MSNPLQWLVDLQAAEQCRRDELPAVKAAILVALKAAKVATVTIEYNGEGDSGQIESITAVNQAGGHVRKPLKSPVRPGVTLHDELNAFAWDVLDAYHDGFENDAGGLGTITIDVAAGSVILDHNDQFTDVINTTTEV